MWRAAPSIATEPLIRGVQQGQIHADSCCVAQAEERALALVHGYELAERAQLGRCENDIDVLLDLATLNQWWDVIAIAHYARFAGSASYDEDWTADLVRMGEAARLAEDDSLIALWLSARAYRSYLDVESEAEGSADGERDLARAMALLADNAAPSVHACAAYVMCALGYTRRAMWELAVEACGYLEQLIRLPWPKPLLAVVEMCRKAMVLNQVEAAAPLACSLMASGMRERATTVAAGRMRLAAEDYAPEHPEWIDDLDAVDYLLAAIARDAETTSSEEILRRMPPDRRNGRRACIHAGCAIRALDAGRAAQAAAHAESALQHLDRDSSWLQILLLEIATAAEPPSATWRRYADASSRVRWNLGQVLVTGARRQIAAEKALLDHQRVSKRAYVDHLTGLANRHAHDRHLARLRTADPADGLTLLMIDVDHFKLINDRFGHAAGDEVLRRLGSILTRATRPSDLAVRLGGDEFLLMISHGLPDAEDRARDLLDHVATHPWHEVAPGLTVGLSIGVISGAARDVDHLLDAGDRCLYDAKRSGRGQIVHAPRS